RNVRRLPIAGVGLRALCAAEGGGGMSIFVADLQAKVCGEPYTGPRVMAQDVDVATLVDRGPFCLICDCYPALLTGPRRSEGHVASRFEGDAETFSVFRDGAKELWCFEAQGGDPGWVFRMVVNGEGAHQFCERGHVRTREPD